LSEEDKKSKVSLKNHYASYNKELKKSVDKKQKKDVQKNMIINQKREKLKAYEPYVLDSHEKDKKKRQI